MSYFDEDNDFDDQSGPGPCPICGARTELKTNKSLKIPFYEADIKIADQLVDLYLEGGGGGNNSESYDLPWAFAATKTSIDCFEKRGKKGYLFTIGDEMTPVTARNDTLKAHGIDVQSDMTADQVLEVAKEKYHIFHIIAEEGSYVRRYGTDTVYGKWQSLLGKRTILMDDHNYLPQIVLSVILVNEGGNPDEVIDRWDDKNVKKSVSRALFGPSTQA